MKPVLLLLGLAAALAGFVGGPARAALGDCTDPAYLDSFPEAPAAGSILCVELFRFTVSTPDGPREIRGISDVAGGWAAPPGAAAGIERGAREAAAAMAALGRFSMDDVTLLLLDDAFSLDADAPDILATTDGRRDGTGARRGECLITLYGLAGEAAPDPIAVTTAHEIFHCIQYASLSAGQMGSYTSGGAWWIEGSAEYFSAVAVTGSEPFTDRGGLFDAAVGEDRSLDRMEHEAAVFFYWWAAGRGPGQLMDFLGAMAATGGASAQHAAMRGVLGDDQWLDFAEAYADARISHPRGGALTLSPEFRDRRSIDRDGTETVTLEPFTLKLGEFAYDCGTWGHELNPSNPNLSARIGEDGPWESWPEELDARDGAPDTIRFVGLSTADSPVRVRNEIERRRSCAPCGGTDRVDACLAGTWQMTSGGPIEWMRGQGLPITRATEGPRYVTFLSDGIYATEPLGVTIELEEDDFLGVGEGYATAAFGRWSAADGQLTVCQDSGVVSGTVTVTHDGVTGSGPVSQAGAGTLRMSYSCSEAGTLSTTLPMPGMAPMDTGYTRIAEEPERDR